MKSYRAWLILGALLCVGLALALASRQRGPRGPGVASIRSTAPEGLAALAEYMRKTRRDVRATIGPFAEPTSPGVLVVAATSHRRIEPGEVDVLRRYVENGGTLVYLAPRQRGTQPALEAWLGVLPAETAKPDLRADDFAGLSARVLVPRGPLRGLRRVRIGAGPLVSMSAPSALQVVEHGALWLQPLGRGKVWVAAGPDLAENRRLELDDNLAFWVQLESGRGLVFDEFHHLESPATPVSTGLWLLAAQVLLCALAFTLARGRRLGPPRPDWIDRHRHGLEYLQSLAGMLRWARVEGELAAALAVRFRRLLFEHEGISIGLPDEEAARLLAMQRRFDAAEVASLLVRARRGLRLTPGRFSELARDFSRLENLLEGRAVEVPVRLSPRT